MSAGQQARDRRPHDVFVTHDSTTDLAGDANETLSEQIDVLSNGSGHRQRMK
jgi:hypothetical protein